MGKAARLACVFVPMCLTLICLVFLALIGLGQTNAGSNYLSNLYFLQANTEYQQYGPSAELVGHKINDQTPDQAKGDDGNIKIYKYYSIGLWSYCAGNGIKVSHATGEFGQPDAMKAEFCSARQTSFVFDPEVVWGLNSTVTTRFFSKSLNDGLHKYTHVLGKAIGPIYIVAVSATAVQLLVGLAGIFSRVGSCCTTVVASVCGVCTFVFSILITAAYFTLAKAFNGALEKDGVHIDVGRTMYIYAWLAVAFQTAATLFWGFSACCVSGRSSDRHRGAEKNIRMVDTPFRSANSGYGKLDGGEGGQGLMQHPAPMGAAGSNHPAFGVTEGTAYEPYRHQA